MKFIEVIFGDKKKLQIIKICQFIISAFMWVQVSLSFLGMLQKSFSQIQVQIILEQGYQVESLKVLSFQNVLLGDA